MLDIRDMFEKDKVFCLVKGLTPWAKTKLYEQKIQDIAFVLTTIERLLNYSGDQALQKKNVTSPSFGYKAAKPNPLKNFRTDKKSQSLNASPSWRSYQSNLSQSRPISCFLCKGPH